GRGDAALRLAPAMDQVGARAPFFLVVTHTEHGFHGLNGVQGRLDTADFAVAAGITEPGIGAPAVIDAPVGTHFPTADAHLGQIDVLEHGRVGRDAAA